MKVSSRWLVAPVLLALAGPAGAQSAGDWLTYGGNDWNQRYSQHKAINTSNVARLVPRMIFQTGIERLGSFENTPIVHNGVMYVTTPYNTAMAYDLNTHKELWRYNHKLGTTIYCCGPNNRGVAIHGGAHVYMGTLDARLVALDAKTGEVLWDKEVDDPTFGYSITHAPIIVGDNVIVGVSGGEYGIRGHVTAYNAGSGEQVWRWYSIPAPQGDPTFDDKAPNGWWGSWTPTTPEGVNLNRDIAKEKADSATHADAWKRGGGGVWMTRRTTRSPTPSSWRSATRRPTWTAACGRATTSTPTRSWPSTPATARPSGTTRRCRTTSGTSTPSRPRW